MNKYFRIIDNKIYGTNASTQGLYFTISESIIQVILDRMFFVSFTGSGDRLSYSDDGITLKDITSGDNSTGWGTAAYSIDKDIISVLSRDTNKVMYSEDRGITWGYSTIDATVLFEKVVYSEEVGLFVAVAATGSNRIYVSSDGKNYTGVTVPLYTYNQLIWAESYGLFIIGGRATGAGSPTKLLTSPDGTTWTERTIPSGSNTMVLMHSNDKGITTMLNTNGSAYSTDGITWTVGGTSGGPVNWSDGKYSESLGKFVAINSNDTNAFVSTDGITWTTSNHGLTTATRIYWNDIIEKFVITAYNGSTLRYSDDAITWTSESTKNGYSYYGGCNIPKSDITPPGPKPIVSGGVVTTYGDYTVHTFNTSGSLVISNGSIDIEYLIVAGGGGGGNGISGSPATGGGGAGGVISNQGSPITLTPSTYTMVVGGGGSRRGGNGSNSRIFDGSTLLYGANGGGGGGSYPLNGHPGGSGGGGGVAGGPASTSGQGNAGGSGVDTGAGGGGGGAGGAGQNATTRNGGAGGVARIIYGFDSIATRYAAGGGGGGSESGGNGGVTGGGAGATGGIGGDGAPNTGSGGGGTYGIYDGGAGGSGIIKIRYKTSDL